MQHLVDVLERLAVPTERIHLALNQTHPSFPGQLSPADVADRLGRTIDHVVPYSKSVPVSMNTGRPAALATWRHGRLARAFRGLSDEVEQLMAGGDGPVEPRRETGQAPDRRVLGDDSVPDGLVGGSPS